jgi:hypothetical protein
MKVGTRSLLFGAHAFWLHPLLVGLAWARLYGWPWSPRLWFAFFLHDIGYLGAESMDDESGERHVELGAAIMKVLFGQAWGDFTAAHSRYWAKRNGLRVSRLCVADKLAFVLTPASLYLPMTRATGELREYMVRAKERQAGSSHFTQDELMGLNSSDAGKWLRALKSYTQRWIDAHRSGAADTWTVTPQRVMRAVRVHRADGV